MSPGKDFMLVRKELLNITDGDAFGVKVVLNEDGYENALKKLNKWAEQLNAEVPDKVIDENKFYALSIQYVNGDEE